MNDLTGQRFGKLVVIERAGSDKNRSITWRCLCDCGSESIVSAGHLKKKIGGTVSCGCHKGGSNDLTGKRFGKLTVTGRVGRNAKGKSMWRCLCDCGNEHITTGSSIQNGGTKSCGCSMRDDIEGMRFGKLVAIGYSSGNKYGGAMWDCKCDCGNITTVRASTLKDGRTTSCGCVRRDELTGKKFGKLLVTGYAGTNKSGKPDWECKCECGNYCKVSAANLKRGTTKSCGCIRREDITGRRSGKLVAKRYIGSDAKGSSLWECTCDCGTNKVVAATSITSGSVRSCGCLRFQKGSEQRLVNLYLISAGDHIKVGIAMDVEKRVRSIQTGCPVPISVLKVYEKSNEVEERMIHALLGDLRTNGEWFLLTDELVSILNYAGTVSELIQALEQRHYMLSKYTGENVKNTENFFNLFGVASDVASGFGAVDWGTLPADCYEAQYHKYMRVPYYGTISPLVGKLIPSAVFGFAGCTPSAPPLCEPPRCNASVMEDFSRNGEGTEYMSFHIPLVNSDDHRRASVKIAEEFVDRFSRWASEIKEHIEISDALQVSAIHSGWGKDPDSLHWNEVSTVISFRYKAVVVEVC